ncbi:MAG TPA: response regulator transcription factor [Bacillota bacterium]|nr:response regulator transcription factor [Bacillota bacterium]HPL54561.1 response regulator transcription factor [Bacillota bacterium]
MKKVLLIEDDLSLIEGLKFSLSKNGFDVTVERTVKEAKKRFNREEYRLVLLDLMLPDGSGFDICKSIRQSSEVPIIFLTASDEEVNVVMGLDLGGDDYISKPFKLNELISRINAVMRRTETMDDRTELSSNGIVVKLLEGRAVKDGKDMELTSVEYRLLCMFMKNPRRVLSRDQIMQNLCDANEYFIDDNTLAVYVSRLREKIEETPKHPAFLLTIRGMGYKWNIVEG